MDCTSQFYDPVVGSLGIWASGLDPLPSRCRAGRLGFVLPDGAGGFSEEETLSDFWWAPGHGHGRHSSGFGMWGGVGQEPARGGECLKAGVLRGRSAGSTPSSPACGSPSAHGHLGLRAHAWGRGSWWLLPSTVSWNRASCDPSCPCSGEGSAGCLGRGLQRGPCGRWMVRNKLWVGADQL